MLNIRKYKFVIFILAAFLVGGLITVGVLDYFKLILKDGSRALSSAEYGSYQEFMDRYTRVDELRTFLKDSFYREIEDDTIMTGLFRGLFESPDDPFTTYFTKEELEEALARTNGEMTGIGITFILNDSNYIEIKSVIPDSPAEKAGLKPGDILTRIDNTDFSSPGADLDAVVNVTKGEAGTEVIVSVLRDGERIEFTIVRDHFITPSVLSKILDDNIGYIAISTFNQGTAEDFEAAIRDMEDKEVKGLIIDVRNNNGGIVDQAMLMLDVMIGESIVAYTEDREGNREPFTTSDGKISIPYAVLVNKHSASAAEIFALGIKNMQEGVVIGETTFGKGVIQKLIRFGQGDGARITVMQYVTPDGTPVHERGIDPDIAIAPDAEGKTDPVLDKAKEILK